MPTRRPNFLVAGAQKCGTSFLCAALAEHPEVFHTEPKEPLFFQRRDVTHDSFSRYLDTFFKHAGNQSRVGEGSTVYFQWPRALGNIRRHLGDELKIIVCLRHPTDRAVSFYLHNLRKGRFTGTERIARVGKDVQLSPVLSSMYSTHIARWLDVFGTNVRFLLFDDLVRAPETFVAKGTDFLELARSGTIKGTAVNKGFPLAWRDGFLEVDAPLGPGQVAPRFSRPELEDLHASFLDDIDKTASLSGLSLHEWKSMPTFTARQNAW